MTQPLRSRGGERTSFELHVLVGSRPRIVGDEPEARLGHARAVALQKGELPDREVHDLFADELLDAVEDHLALLPIQLGRLLPEEAVNVRIAPISVDAAG